MTAAEVLVVGGSSPLGRAVVGKLRASGIAVAATGRDGGDVHLDLSHAAQVSAVASSGVPAIVFLARWIGQDDDAEGIKQFAASSRRFFQIAHESGTRRVIFASSAAIYGTAWETAISETNPLRGDTNYARLKILTEESLEEWGDHSSTAISLRIFNMYGPGLENSLVNRLVSQSVRPRLLMSKSYVRDYVHCHDVADACSAALTTHRSGFEAINIGTGIRTHNLKLAELAGANAFEPVPSDASDFSVANISRAQELLDFEPKYRLADAFYQNSSSSAASTLEGKRKESK